MSRLEPSKRATVGLCFDCRHARRITSARQSSFYRCERAARDERLRAYPPLPVQRCPGYEAGEAMPAPRAAPDRGE